MIKLYNFGTWQGIADPSPFCTKVDCYMRAAGIEFETVSGTANLGKAPKKKLPFIDHDGKIIGDSTFIIEYLKEQFGDPLDAELNPEQRAVTRAFAKMLDENLYWCIVEARWLGEMWPQIRESFFGNMPIPLRWIVPPLARRGVRKTLQLQGLGRHSDSEILHIARKDLQALSDYLGNKEYFLLNKVTTLDVCAYAFLVQLIRPESSAAIIDMAREFRNLVAFVERIHNAYYAA